MFHNFSAVIYMILDSGPGLMGSFFKIIYRNGVNVPFWIYRSLLEDTHKSVDHRKVTNVLREFLFEIYGFSIKGLVVAFKNRDIDIL